MHNKCLQSTNIQTTLHTENYVSETRPHTPNKLEHDLPQYFFVHDSKCHASKKKKSKNLKANEQNHHTNSNRKNNYSPNSDYPLLKNSDNLLNHNKVSSKENDHNSKSDLPKIYSEPFSIKNPNETKEVPSYRQFEKKKSQLFTFEDEILNYPKNYEIPINSRSETSVKNNYDISANYRQDTSKYEPYKPSEIFNGSANGTHCFSNIPTHLSKYMKNETSKENEFQDIQNTYFKSQISNYDPFPNNNTKYESHYRNEAYSNPSTYLKPIELEKTKKIQRIPYKPISNYNSSIKINENAAVYDNVSKYSNLEALSIPFNPKSSESSINNNDIGHSKISYQEIRPYYYDNIYNEKTKSEISNTIKTSSSEENPIKRVIIDNTIKKTKRKLPNPFLYIPKSDENFSEKKAQETPRCIFLNKGRITPKSNTNANVFFKSKAQNDLPINNPSYFENACEINNDNLSHNSFYPAKLFDSKYFSSTNYYELNKPIELTTYQMDLGEEEPKEQKESFTSYNPKEFILEEKIKNISQCSKKNAENMEIYKPILKNVISLPPLFSKDKKTSVNREIQERSSIADTLEKALEILNETANNVYTKNVKPERENHLKSEEKITENELKHVKKENESPSHNTNIQENTNDLEEVSNLVSNQSKKHKILRSNTNNIPNDKNWGDFPCVRSLSSICTNSNSQISKEDLRKQIKFEKPLLQEKNEEISIQKELSMDDLPSISSPENKNKVSHQDQSKIKPTPCEENLEIELKRNSKSLNFNPFKFESLENAPSIIEITNQKDQCELGSQSDLEELQENQKILNLGEKILKMQTLDIYKFEKLKVPKTYSSKNFRSLSAFNKNSQLHLEMGGLDYLDEINNKPKSKSECILISNTDSFKNSVDELSESDKGITDQRTLSIDEGKIILFEEANYSFQAEILSQIDEENDGKSKKVKFEVKKRIKGNYFKKIKENMRKRREKIFVNQKEEKNEKMDKTEKNKGNYFQKLKEKKRKQKYENNQFEEKEKSDINLKKWSGFQTYRKMKVNNGFYQNFSLFKNKLKLQDEIFVEKKGRNNYFKKLKNQNKEKKANKFKVIEETHENLKSNKKEEIQINKKLGYFSQLRKKKHQKKQAQSENAYPELVTINYAKWDKFVFLTQKKKQKGNFFQNEKRKTILAYNEKKRKASSFQDNEEKIIEIEKKEKLFQKEEENFSENTLNKIENTEILEVEKDESDLNAFNLNSEEIQDLPDYLFSNDKIYDSPNFSKSSGDPKHKMKIINLEEIIDKNEENTFNNEDVKDTNAKLIDQNKSKSIHIQNDNEFIVEKNRLINIQENKETNFTVVDQNKSRDIQENNESNIKVDDIQNESIDFQDKHENNNTIFEESSKLEKYKEGESISYSLEDLKNIEKKEIKLEDDLVKVFYKAISIKPIDPKFAKFSSPAQDVIKFEENDNLTEFSTQNNCKFLNDSNEEQYSSVPPKNPIIPSQKKFNRLGKYADIALNLEELLGNRKEPPIVPKNDEYKKLGKYAEVALALEQLFSGKTEKKAAPDRNEKKRISFEDFLQEKSIEIEKKNSPIEMNHIKFESPINLPKNRRKQKSRIYEFEI